MAIRIPDRNFARPGAECVRLVIGAGACAKPANTAAVTIMWFETPVENGELADTNILLSYVNGRVDSTVPHGGRIAFLKADNDIKVGGVSPPRATVNCPTSYKMRVALADIDEQVAPLKPLLQKRYMLLHAVNADYRHLVLCEPDGTILSESVSNTAMFTTAFTTNQLWGAIGGGVAGSGTNKGWWGPVEDFNFWHGAFPESAPGVPDETLIRALAAGTQSLAGLQAELWNRDGTDPGAGATDAIHQVRYRMRDRADLTDALGLKPPLTVAVTTPAVGAVIHDHGPLAPGSALVPARTVHNISQVVFGTPGDTATATAQIKVEGGSYSGLPTMGKVQVRLADENETVVRDWIDLTTTAPVGGAGTWAASDGFLGVPMQASVLYRRFRAVDSGGAVLATCSGYGVSGAGFHMVAQSQSQWTQGNTGSPGKDLAGIRGVYLTQQSNGEVPPDPSLGELGSPPRDEYTRQFDLSGMAESVWGIQGNRQVMTEVNALYPGVPIQLSNIGMGGTALSQYRDPGPLAPRWAALKRDMSVVQPYVMMFFGHSSSAGEAAAEMPLVVAYTQAQLGTPIRYLHVSVPRNRNDTVESVTFTQMNAGRNAIRAYCEADVTGLHWWMGSWSNIWTPFNTSGVTTREKDATNSDPHPANGEFGMWRTAALVGQSLLMATRAVPDVPIGITAVRVVGADAVIEFGAVNT